MNVQSLTFSANGRSSQKGRYYFILATLLLAMIACGTVNPEFLLNNEVRRAVFEYEREMRGPVKDLVIHFRRDEPRIRFEGQNQNGGHTIWLYPAGAEEYFATRSDEGDYLYLQEIQYSKDRSEAAVKVYRGNKKGYQGWQLTVTREASGHWVVTDEVAIEDSPIK